MSEVSFDYKRAFYYLVASVFTFINFLAFLISRNNPWVINPGRNWQFASSTKFLDYPASDFERAISCYAIHSCQRIGSALMVQPIIFMTDLISKAYFWNVGDEARIFNIQMIGISWRACCIGMIFILSFRITRSIWFSFLYLNAILITLSGVFLRVSASLTDSFVTLDSPATEIRVEQAFQDFPHEQLVFYDYTNFLVFALTAILLTSKFQVFSFRKLFVIGLIFTSLFEFHGFIFCISLLALNFPSATRKDWFNSAKQTFAVVLGSISWLAFVTSYFFLVRMIRPEFYTMFNSSLNSRGGSGDIFWALKNPMENLSVNPSMYFQIFLVLIQSGGLGLAFGRLSRNMKIRFTVDSNVLKTLLCLLTAHGLVQFVAIFVTYGVEGMAGEHSRQTLGLQIALFTYLFLRTASSKKTDELVHTAT